MATGEPDIDVAHRDVTYTPFGSPDAANDGAPPPPFELAELSAYARMAASGFDPLARVLVGRMGTGKTRYLIELRKLMAGEGVCELTEIEADLPNLTAVTRLAEDLHPNPVERAETWRKIWERSIVSATMSWMSTDGSTQRMLIYSEFARILRDYPTLHALRDYLDSPDWDVANREFEQALAGRSQPLCFFLDAVEEDSAHAPLYWLWCQKGLVTQVLKYARKQVLADKLRIFLCIRDQTWRQLQQTISSARLEQHPVVRVLKWDAHLVADFLGQKISRLPPEYLMQMPSGSTRASDLVAAWLGTEEIANDTRGVGEDITKYILRHTRLIPRDIVTMGNLLARETFAAKRRGESELSPERIRRAVAESARLSAAEELQWCGLEIVSKQLAAAQSTKERRSIAPDEDAAARATDQLKTLLRGIGQDTFTNERFLAFEADAKAAFGASIAFAPLLWRHGLVGWGSSTEGPFGFSLRATLMPLDQPPSGNYVAMHPMLIDALPVDAEGKTPVVPFDEDEMP